MVAILPAAGMGTRMRSVSSASKELLRVGSKPVLQWVLEEAIEAGADRCVVVISPAKPDLQEFISSQEGAQAVVQEVATGLAPAVVLASRLEPTLLLLPDTVFWPHSPLGRIAKALSRGFDFAIAVERVSEEQVSRYGIVEWNAESGRISRILEKPRPDQTASRWAIAARFGLSPRTILFVRQRVAALSGGPREIDLPPILNEAVLAGHTGLAVPLESGERRMDCGNPEGYRTACEALNASL